MEALSCIRFSYILLFVSYVAAQNAETKSPEGFATLEAPKSVPSPSPVPVPSPSPVPVPSPSPVPVPVPSTTPRQKADVPEKDLMQALYLTETPDRTVSNVARFVPHSILACAVLRDGRNRKPASVSASSPPYRNWRYLGPPVSFIPSI